MVMSGFAVYFFLKMVRLDILLSPFVALSVGISAAAAIGFVEHRTWEKMASMVGIELARSKAVPAIMTARERRQERKRKRHGYPVQPTRQVRDQGSDFVRFVKVVVLIVAVFFCFQSYRSGNVFAGANVLGIGADWWDATGWLAVNTSSSDVVMSWWDYGYWIQVYSHRKTLADGATIRDLRPLAHAFIDSEDVASRFCEKFNVSYVVLDLAMDVVQGKWTAMSFIASVSPSDLVNWRSDGGIESLKERGTKSTIMMLASEFILAQPIPMVNFTNVYRSRPYGEVAVYAFRPHVGA